ncbi:SMP-30/gluconolactonase/LRE family protein [Flavobacteriaceae bacterium TP-CH-4]|uniref:SMP-30/gluconolactonase/LRE family protein n=1 Tax=Pelagihabitans pacificus TaxID=2696054 RepID=A0A967ARA6_9FLAO|nr:SMP-30/gluconolactonase/LRE family protein [Pelagihabitans pacificus]NHF58934.1 SMP-30/gluconolactonase/LRE family protein [Pelagihabitans pacificus]
MNIGQATILLKTRSVLGEGPVWDWKKQRLWWVDIEGNLLHELDPITKKHRYWSFDEMIGAAVPAENGQLLLALESGLATFSPLTGELMALGVLENSDREMRFNDGKVGPEGNFWIGSMHKKLAPKTGNLYCVDTNWKVSLKIPETTISNGMVWTTDQCSFYYIDTAAHEVWKFDYDSTTSEIKNKRVAFSVPEHLGGADGMTIDAEDMLWIAHWGGQCIRRWNPISGEVLEEVAVDAPHVTSCCFGGKDFDSLYITTARSGLSDAQLKEYPQSGGLFVYKPKVVGRPITYFKNG